MMKSYITAIGTATPAFEIPQIQAAAFMSEALEMNAAERRALHSLYRATGIEKRYSILEDYIKSNGDFNFFPNNPGLEPFPTVSQRMILYEKEAIALSLNAIESCFKQKKINKNKVTHLITVSCTGMYAPGLDIEIIEKTGLNTSVQRTAINYMGCYASFNALKVADAFCKSDPEAVVLIVAVELCTLHFQKGKSPDQLVSNAIFGDGAAAVLIESSNQEENISFSLESFFCDLAPEGKNDMAWRISDFGFEMTLSSYVPSLIQNGIKKLTENLLRSMELNFSEIGFFAIHPGGRKILEVIEEALGISKEQNRFAYQVLKDFGNMSSVTVLFVLFEIMKMARQEDQHKNILSFAFGPGLTLESMLLKVQYPAKKPIANKKSVSREITVE